MRSGKKNRKNKQTPSSKEKAIKNELLQRIHWAEQLLTESGTVRLDQSLADLGRWISYFQHERLIHLLVTELFAMLTMLAFILFMLMPATSLLLLLGLLLLLLIPYIRHYYLLENGVQKLYLLLDGLQEKQRQEDRT